MIQLPNTVRNSATFRILTMPEGTWDAQVWTSLPVPAILSRVTGNAIGGTVLQGGYQLQSVSRWTLPDEDRAEFFIDTGYINGTTVTALDLKGRCVRIQVYDDPNFPQAESQLPTSGWKTVFCGSIISTSNDCGVGEKKASRVSYHCAGMLWRTRNWPLDRHSTSSVVHAKGHPGYNVPLHGVFRKVLGNKGVGVVSSDPFGDLTGDVDILNYYVNHAMPVDGVGATTTKFTDEEVVKHAVASSRAIGEPKFEVSLSLGLFTGTYSWPVSVGETCWDLLRRVCNRQRGRGSVYLSYVDVGGGGAGTVELIITAKPSHVSKITYNTIKTAGDLDLQMVNEIKSVANGDYTSIDVDINGDHRVTDAGFRFDNRYSSVYDAVIVQGEPIQVLANLNFFGGSLDKRWSHGDAAKDEELFGAIPLDEIYQRTSARWRHVWRRFGFPQTFVPNITVKAEPGGTAYPINFWTNKDGTVEVVPSSLGSNSEMTYKVLSDLPIYEGWKYDTLPFGRFDGAADYIPPSRMPPIIMYQADTDRSTEKTWVPLSLAGFNLQTDDFGFYIVNGIEDSSGYRMLATKALAPNAYIDFTTKYVVPDVTVSSGLDLQKFNTTLGVELGTRVSFTRTDISLSTPMTYESALRRFVMTVSGINLWLGAPGAVWELDYARAAMSNKWNAGLKLPSDKLAVIIRDDRNELSFISALAWEYYGKIHNPGTWTLRDCGLMSGFMTTESVSYPALGQLIGKVTYAGTQDNQESAQLNTPVTSIHYDHESGETTWRTDFVSYDGNTQ